MKIMFAIRKELEDFSDKLLMNTAEIIIANKMDGERAKDNLSKYSKEEIR